MNKRQLIFSGVTSILISILAFVGFHYTRGTQDLLTHAKTYTVLPLLFIALGIIIHFSWMFLDALKDPDRAGKISKEDKNNYRKPWLFLVSFIFILLAWMPYYLASFPGFFCYDATQEFNWIEFGEYNEHHPLLHQLFVHGILRFFYEHFQDWNIGIAVFSIMQIIIGALIFAGVSTMLLNATRKKTLFVLSTLFFGLTPPIALFAGCSTKDVFSSLLVILYLQWFCKRFVFDNEDRNGSWKRKATDIIFSVIVGALMLHMKKNIPMAFVAFFLCQLFVKDKLKKRLFLMAITIVSYILLTISLRAVFNPERSSIRESLSIPSQQIVDVYSNYGKEAFTEEEWAQMNKLFKMDDLKESYIPQLADPIKGRILEDAINNNTLEFFDLWFSVGRRHPVTYIDGFLVMTYQAWYPFTVLNGYNTSGYDYYWCDTCYFICCVEPPGTHNPILPKFYDKLIAFSLYDSQYKIPPIGLISSIGTYMWILIYTVMYLLYKKQYKKLLPLSFIMLLTFTSLMGPIVLVRYYLALIYACPLMIAMIISKDYSHIKKTDK